jgi:ribosomal protein S18 acetylase RimI-like enzyme
MSNAEAIRLYGKLGFERGEMEAEYYPDGEAALIMYKRL